MNKIAILITSLLIILSGEYFLFTTMQFPPLIEAIDDSIWSGRV